MNTRDKQTVETYVGTGMDLDTLYTCFSDFSREEVAEIYNNYKASHSMEAGTNSMSINCS
ncbi:MAG: hypothetical protein K5769_01010 [Pseudobutyrivibrio sp.]|nr:hypothetical protein [Pseudobutyrivibrio sp.]